MRTQQALAWGLTGFLFIGGCFFFHVNQLTRQPQWVLTSEQTFPMVRKDDDYYVIKDQEAQPLEDLLMGWVESETGEDYLVVQTYTFDYVYCTWFSDCPTKVIQTAYLSPS